MTARVSPADDGSVPVTGAQSKSPFSFAPTYNHDGLIAYRPDIDGLRAVAVIPVVLYHVGIYRFHGGFVGVDVFFVISGYLITQLLSRDLDAGRYSIVQFYVRRARRIFPALFAMMAIVALVMLFLALPREASSLQGSMAAATLFASNIYFYLTENYFGPGRASLPLLHTWSLAVEEQFYIAFPLVLWLLRRRLAKLEKPVLVALAIASLAAAEWMVRSDQPAAFYLPHLRAWELLVGSLLALNVFGAPSARWLRQALGLLGLAAIGLASVWYRDNLTLFPGVSALLPTIGAALVIYSGQRSDTLCAWGLSLAPVRFIGLISYSLYLWHWPIIVFYAYHVGFNRPLTLLPQVILVAASFLAAVLSWRFIETPFRAHGAKKRAQPAAVLGFSAAIMCTLLAVSAVLPATNAWLRPVGSEGERILAVMDKDHITPMRNGTCLISRRQALSVFDRETCLSPDPAKKNYLLIGDSHASDLWEGLASIDPGIKVLQANVAACTPIKDSNVSGTCGDFLKYIFSDYVPQHHFDKIIISGRWGFVDVDGALQTARALQPYADQVVIFGPSVEYDQPLPRALVLSQLANDPGLLDSHRLAEQKRVDGEFEARARDAGVAYFSVYRALCPDDHCTVMDADGLPIQFDADHVTLAGAKLVALAARRAGLF